MTYYHPTWSLGHEHYLKHGFLSLASLHKLEMLSGRGQHDTECRTLACTSFEAALEYAKAFHGSIDITIIQIEGEYDSWPITGTLVPEGTVFLMGEIPADCVSLSEQTQELERRPSKSPKP